ncbi:hypothetical protein DPEC_G00020900 [Dallia pectoralis]|uniref:Uncharacterized protein n=1 Tax=Dallia pectoralis TaxID=75939 RepID=A0ACC2HGH3_DALPE|nr:hypothetical protein DPEC_G00020900 [Dallia pectoralis]
MKNEIREPLKPKSRIRPSPSLFYPDLQKGRSESGKRWDRGGQKEEVIRGAGTSVLMSGLKGWTTGSGRLSNLGVLSDGAPLLITSSAPYCRRTD